MSPTSYQLLHPAILCAFLECGAKVDLYSGYPKQFDLFLLKNLLKPLKLLINQSVDTP